MKRERIALRAHDGIALAADSSGPEDGPLVILAHGGGQTRHSWGSTPAALAQKGFAVLSLDLRGHGESEWSAARAYDLAHYASDLADVVRARAGGRPVALVGASLGGMASLLVAGDPDMGVSVAGIVLVDVVPRVERSGAQRIREFMSRHPEGFATLAEAADAIAAYRGRPRSRNLAGLAKNLRPGAGGRYHWHWDPAMLEGMSAGSRKARAELLERAARHVQVPALLVRGAESDVVSPEGVKAFRELIPHLEFVDVAHAGHIVVGDRNDVFQDAILEFLARVLPRRNSA